MIARPKISRNEWKAAEIGAFEVGNVALFCCPEADVVERDAEHPPRDHAEEHGEHDDVGRRVAVAQALEGERAAGAAVVAMAPTPATSLATMSGFVHIQMATQVRRKTAVGTKDEKRSASWFVMVWGIA